VAQRLPVLRDNRGGGLHAAARQCPGEPVKLNAEMRKMRAEWKRLTSGK
jgi:hypothetical protein